MIVLLSIIAINITIVSLLVSCGKKQDEAVIVPSVGTLNRDKDKEKGEKVEITFAGDLKTTEIPIVNPQHMENPMVVPPRTFDIYHDAALENAYPASKKCKNHDDAWRMLALYLDYIRSVNPEDFLKHNLLDSGMAVLHDMTNIIGYDQANYPSEHISLAVLYFLIKFHEIKVNLGNEKTPWFTVLCKDISEESLEKMRLIIEKELIENNSRTRSTPARIEKEHHSTIVI